MIVLNCKYLLKGPIDIKKIHVYYKSQNYEFIDKINLIDKCFLNESIRVRNKGIRLYDRSLYRLLNFSKTKTRLNIFLSNTKYKYYVVGLKYRNQLLGRQLVNYFPLSISAVMITSDNYIVLGKRSFVTYRWPKKINLIPAGYPEIRNRKVNLIKELQRELKEETGVISSEIDKIYLLGIVKYDKINKPEIIYLMRTKITFNEIRRKYENSKDNWEHHDLIKIPASKKNINNFLISTHLQLTPFAIAGLRLYYKSITKFNS